MRTGWQMSMPNNSKQQNTFHRKSQMTFRNNLVIKFKEIQFQLKFQQKYLYKVKKNSSQSSTVAKILKNKYLFPNSSTLLMFWN